MAQAPRTGEGSRPGVTVTVVIPVRNDDVELERCLRALRCQSRQVDEIIVVDNGSMDRSADVALVAGATVIECREPGIPASSSRGYDRASGDLILRLDADCVPSASWVQTIVDAFATHRDVALFTGGARFIDGPSGLRTPLAAAYLLGYAIATTPALGHLPLFGSNFAMRREVWDVGRSRVHRHDPDIHDDLDLAFHLGEWYRIRFLPGASMGISMRPFDTPGSFLRRTYRGFRTVLVHWPRDFPPFRWLRLALRHRAIGILIPAAHDG